MVIIYLHPAPVPLSRSALSMLAVKRSRDKETAINANANPWICTVTICGHCKMHLNLTSNCTIRYILLNCTTAVIRAQALHRSMSEQLTVN